VKTETQKLGLATHYAEDCGHAVIEEVVLAPQQAELDDRVYQECDMLFVGAEQGVMN
jgi:hypothetical protein